MNHELPKVVRWLVEGVSGKLGRPAHCRKVKNRDEWFVYDPVFSFVQRGMNSGGSGYRVGYHFLAVDHSIVFTLVHSPIMARLFKRNLDLPSMIEVIRSTGEYRKCHWVYRSSKRAVRQGGDGERIESPDLEDFADQIQAFDRSCGFIDDMFPTRSNTGKGAGKAPSAGNTFYLLLAEKARMLRSKPGIDRLVDRTWPLFLCLYPLKPRERRAAGLARSLRVRGIPKMCEFSSIRMSRKRGISPVCRGEIQGAHIRPDSLGGSDRPENGIWLCEYHHRATEGRLAGNRNGDALSVRFVSII